MPTPFMHLYMAEQMRVHSRFNGRVRALVEQEWPAFYMGSVAADVNSISTIPREATHFYQMPPAAGERADQTMLARYPQLAEAKALSSAQAVFIAAYSAHLLADVWWFHQVLIPYFFTPPHWAGQKERFKVHNMLLTYLDQQAFEALPTTAATTLAAATPQNWLPFAPDGILINWRQTLVNQLQPGGVVETVSVYAGRLHISPEDFAAHLHDSQWMIENVFCRVPIEQVQAGLAAVVEESVGLVSDYLAAIWY
ncbi:MAG: zinc dependent phospholipase C family protein [Chloroflexota bacterium]